jgi:tol-pal system protein YbgF
LLVIAPLTALCACATESMSRSEVAELRAEVRMLRESNARLERRLERMEGEAAVLTARPAAAPAAAPAPAQATAPTSAKSQGKVEVPELAVVKLQPKAEPVPRLDVSTPVVEPSSEVLEELAQVREAPARERDEDSPTDPAMLDGLYEAGLEALRTGNVEGGVAKLKAFAQENPRHPKADNALYFSGLGLMGLEEYAQAARTFDQVLTSYPAGDAVVDSMLKLAECRVRLNQRKDAKALYVKLISQYPGTAAATQAESRLASLTP